MITAIAIITLVVGGGVFLYKQQTLDHYDQQMEKYDGFFTELALGEFFEIDWFTATENATTAMDLSYLKSKNDKLQIFKDQNGYYLKYEVSKTYGEAVRLYLPKDAWFKQFEGSVKSFKDRESENSELLNKFSLLFYLRFPNLSIRTKQLDKNGKEFYGPMGGDTDDSRGWDVYNKYKVSGYFSLEGNKIRKKVTTYESLLPQEQSNLFNEQVGMGIPMGGYSPYGGQEMERKWKRESEEERKNELREKVSKAQLQTPGGLSEYSYQSEEYTKSDFDVWYDSAQGTLIIIGVQIAVGILTSGFGNEIMLGCETYAYGTALKAGIVLAGEVAVGLPEALYLYNRGYTQIAGLICLCCFIPLITEFKLGRMILNLPPPNTEILFKLVQESKTWKTPREFLAFMKTLDKTQQEFISQRLSALAVYYSKNGTRQIVEQSSKALAKEFDRLAQTTVKKAITNQKDLIEIMIKTWKTNNVLKSAQKILPNIKYNNFPILSSLGFTTALVFGFMGTCILIFENNEKFLTDPNGVLEKFDKSVKYFTEELPKSQQILMSLTQASKLAFDEAMKDPTKEKLQKAVNMNTQVYIVFKNLALFYNSGQKNGWANADFSTSARNQLNKEAYSILLKLQCMLLNNIIQKSENLKKQGKQEEADKAIDELKNVTTEEEVSEYDKLEYGGYLDRNDTTTSFPANKIAYKSDGTSVIFDKEDFDQFLYWFMGYKECSLKNSSPWFVTTKQSFSCSIKVPYADYSTGSLMFKLKPQTHSYSSSNWSTLLVNDYKTMCNTFVDKNSIEQDFYNCKLIRQIFTNYFDDWLVSKDYLDWESKKLTGQTEKKTATNNLSVVTKPEVKSDTDKPVTTSSNTDLSLTKDKA